MKWRYLTAAALSAILLASGCEHPHHRHPTLACIRHNESAVGTAFPHATGYNAQNPRSSASGAYQFIDSTWRNITREMGTGTEYAKARHAPPVVQDAVAYWAIVDPGKYRRHWTGANSRC